MPVSNTHAYIGGATIKVITELYRPTKSFHEFFLSALANRSKPYCTLAGQIPNHKKKTEKILDSEFIARLTNSLNSCPISGFGRNLHIPTYAVYMT